MGAKIFRYRIIEIEKDTVVLKQNFETNNQTLTI